MSNWRPVLANILVVTVVSLLLWLWAAGQTRETSTVQLNVHLVASDDAHMVAIPVEALPVEVELQGSRRELERASDRLTGKTIILRTGRPGVPTSAGSHVIDLAQALGRNDEVAASGAAVVNTSPGTMSMELVETVTVEATVTPIMPGVQLSGEAVAEPAKVRLTLPKSLAPALGSDPRIEAFLPAAQANALQAGRRHDVDVPLRLPETLQARAGLARWSPERVHLRFTLLSRSSSAVLRLVPVQVSGPPDDLDGYRITIKPDDSFLREVEVTGPTETIRALEDGRAKAFAFVHLSADDLALRVTRKRIDLWLLPPGVTVTRIGDSLDTAPQVRLGIAQR